MKVSLRKIFILSVILCGLGFLVAVSGVIPIKASSGHWSITEWALNFGKTRSVSTHSLGIKVPPEIALDDPAWIAKGAGAYQNNCYSCHGATQENQRPVVTGAMTPKPPFLPPRMDRWEPRELFYIVKHGIKFTGMPAWPAQNRDDEIWAVVAFLRELPDLDEAGYRKLTEIQTESESGPELTQEGWQQIKESCSVCHDQKHSETPALAGQSLTYLQNSLAAFASGERSSGIMQPIAAALSPDLRLELSQFYAAQAPNSRSSPGDAESIERGRLIALEVIPSQKIPAFEECHVPAGTKRRDEYPFLSGQSSDYLIRQLKLFAADSRGGTSYAHLMQRHVAGKLTDRQVSDVAAFYQNEKLSR